ncbi:hypothetical protein C7413_1181, partial [Paraburkholderia silvatlantica]
LSRTDQSIVRPGQDLWPVAKLVNEYVGMEMLPYSP